MCRIRLSDLYCRKCRKRVTEIVEEYKGKLKETRTWDGENWELKDSNIDQLEYVQKCPECKTVVE